MTEPTLQHLADELLRLNQATAKTNELLETYNSELVKCRVALVDLDRGQAVANTRLSAIEARLSEVEQNLRGSQELAKSALDVAVHTKKLLTEKQPGQVTNPADLLKSGEDVGKA